jgi:hypothetical protein
MLPMLAMLVGGYMAKQSGQAAGPGGGLGGMIGGMLGRRGAEGGGAVPRASGGLASMLDLDGDGNPLDDILRTVGKVKR